MISYIVRRLGLLVPTLFIITILVFLLIRIIPGNIIDMMVAEHIYTSREAKEQGADEIRRMLGLDVPIYEQYGRWVWNILRGDFGKSLWSTTKVVDDLRNRLPVSIELGLMALIIGQAVAFPIGIYSAIRQDTVWDYVGRSASIAFLSVPGFWLGTMVMVYPSIWWNWSPPVQYIPLTVDPIGNLQQFIIPALIMGLSGSGTSMRMTRTMMLEVLRQDYIRTAWSKGMKERLVVTRHALKNALIPVVTIIGMGIPVLVGGTVIMEQIFALPGMGRLMIESLTQRDYIMLSGVNLFIAAFVLLNNLVVDILYGYLDPRIRYR
ncbi:MAG: ABC transporter permease [Dehalococcoidia bacterium]|nr:ABC transporter permease [Dehalococcoidia bacterium]